VIDVDAHGSDNPCDDEGDTPCNVIIGEWLAVCVVEMPKCTAVVVNLQQGFSPGFFGKNLTEALPFGHPVYESLLKPQRPGSPGTSR
jgi:hypothetical protein